MFLGISVANAAQLVRIPISRFWTCEPDRLVAYQAERVVDSMGVDSAKVQFLFRPSYKDRAILVEVMEPLEVEVCSVHHIDGTGLGHKKVEDSHIDELAVRDPDEGGDAAVEVEEGVKLYRPLRSTEVCPREEVETEIDGSGVEGVNCSFQLEIEGLIGVEASGLMDKNLGEVGIDAPITVLVSVRQRAPRDLTSKTHVVELAGNNTQTSFDVSETLAKRQLRESHGEELIPTGKSPDAVVTSISPHASVKRLVRYVLQELSKDCSPLVHLPLPNARKW